MELMSYQLQHDLIQHILNISDIELLKQLQALINSKEKTQVLTSFEKKIVFESKQQINEGKYFTNEEVFTDLKTWLLNEK